jgi:hypothetical protein
VPLHAAPWNRDGFVSVSEPDPATGVLGKWEFVIHNEVEGVQVLAIAVRTLMTEMRISCVEVLKVDIESAERKASENCEWMESAVFSYRVT